MNWLRGKLRQWLGVDADVYELSLQTGALKERADLISQGFQQIAESERSRMVKFRAFEELPERVANLEHLVVKPVKLGGILRDATAKNFGKTKKDS